MFAAMASIDLSHHSPTGARLGEDHNNMPSYLCESEDAELEKDRARTDAIHALISPSSIAVIGATATSGKLGNVILRSLLDYGYKGNLYPVNPRYENILGLRCFSDLESVVRSTGEIPDSVYITVPPAQVMQCLRDAAIARVRSVTVVSSGMASGSAGAGEERETLLALQASGTVMLGPNCLGIHNPAGGVTFNANMSRRSGPVAFVSQSGSMTEVFLLSMESRGVGTHLAVSTGNESMLTISDFLSYLADVEEVRVVAAYVEEIRDPEKFVGICRQLSRDKIVVVYMAGSTNLGRRAASSHTGAIASSSDAYSSLLKKAYAIYARSYDELVDVVTAAAAITHPAGKKAAIISAPGGLCVTLSDALDGAGLEMPDFEPRLKSDLEPILPQGVIPRNPLDLTMAATTQVDLYSRCASIIAANGGWDMIIIGAPTSYSTVEFVHAAEGIGAGVQTPLAVVWMGETPAVSSGIRSLGEMGIPAFRSPEAAARSLSILASHHARLRGTPYSPLPAFHRKDGKGHERWLAPDEIRGLLGAGGIENYDNFPVRDFTSAAGLAKRLGYPVVLKLSSEGLVHKSEAGGVIVGIRSDKELRAAIERLRYIAEGKLHLQEYAFTLSRHIAAGVELTVGAFRSLGGTVIMFGLGGILIELTGAMSFAFCPIDVREALEMVGESGLGQLLSGYRGIDLGDERLLSFLVRISELLAARPDVIEMDINPLIANAQGLWPVDLRVLLRR